MMAQFMPTFNEVAVAPSKVEVTEDIEEDEIKAELEPSQCFMFVVDRSGSMSGSRMEITKEALRLFIMSLPVNSCFSVISFGTSSNYMRIGNSA